MLRARRQQLHGAIAQVLEKRFPEVIASTPEVIAQQFEGAGRTEQAIRYWQQAGDRDLRRFAMKEAVAHHSSALRLATAMPEGQARNELELGIRLALGLTQLIAIGPSSDVAKAHYRQALVLSSALPDRGRERFLATWGLWFNATISARWAEASELADQLLGIARELDNSDFLLEAYHAKVPMMMRVPDFAGMTETAHEVFRLYSRDRHRDHAYYFGGHDSRMCARSFYAQAQWGLGLLDQAKATVRESIEDARDLGHLFTLAHALQRGGHTLVLLRDAEACRAVADELYPLAERNKFPWQLSDAKFLRGWLAGLDGDYESGIEQMQYAADAKFAAGTFLPIFLTQIADFQLRAGTPDRAMATLDRAIDVTQTQGNHFCEPDIFRLRGEALAALSPNRHDDAEAAMREALAIADHQSCRILELRAAVSLANLWAATGRRDAARDLLAPIYGSFTEGFTGADLQDAKACLEQLR
jgi:predicted ATPase